MKRTAIKRGTSLTRKSRLRPHSARQEAGGARVRTLPDGRQICNQAAWRATRPIVWGRDGRRCVRCGRSLLLRDAEIDHVNPRGLGGGKRDDRAANLQTLCHPCHRAKHGA